VVVRRAVANDTDTIAEVFVASFRGLDFVPRIHTDDEIRGWIREEMIPSHEVWVADDGRGVVGFAALTDDLLGHLYVRPDAQGRGAGSALLDRVKAERPGGFRFWVFQQNERARRFYERRHCRLLELGDGSGNMEKLPDALYEWLPGATSTSAEPAPPGAGDRGSRGR
jgi:GNAT superfamily N-acetyltransferase